ncbi:MAG: hypothetical protein HY788_16780 [Deltaproteobacteria bacterium]|nr:hypothetical protein [Deltaproteobacteria bacterium]
MSESADEKRCFAFSDAADKRREPWRETRHRIRVLGLIEKNGMEFRNRNDVPYRIDEVTGIGIHYGSVIRG